MLELAAQERALLALAENGTLQGVRPLNQGELSEVRPRGVVCAIEGEATVAGNDVKLRVGVDGRFPLSLPIIFLSPPDALGFIPHVEIDGDGYVCYAQAEGLLLDSQNPVGILQEAVKRAKAVLRDGVTGENRWDFTDEFSAYWVRVAEKFAISFYLDANDVLREVYCYRSSTGYALVTNREEDVRAYFNGSGKALDSLTRRAALYVPLRREAFVLPPRKGKLWNVQDIQKLVRDNLTEDNSRELERLGKRYKSEELVVLAVPRHSGGVTLIGLVFRGVVGGHPLLNGTAQNPPLPVRLQRHDVAYLLPRGGTRLTMRGIRVLLTGCGAIGGHIALALARAGISQLTLVDHDEMQVENTFRHVLGNSAVGQSKAEALRKEIALKYPYVSISGHREYIEEAISKGLVKLRDFHLVIFALGNPTTELYVNRLLHQGDRGPKAVFTWVEPYGIGGHALLTLPGAPGCLECLYTRELDETLVLDNRAAFAAHGQFFGKDDLGCGNLYTPFGALDAQRSAELVVGLALDAMMGREQGSPLLSWKGSDNDFVEAGFRLSPRYQLSTAELYERRYDYVRPDCPACGEDRR
ncbi:MAG: ThiF family adenylyltransferase [Chloroflexi bacterium]|nr:ThiF family adenylyltransferase [Chloroflexota bacterium]